MAIAGTVDPTSPTTPGGAGVSSERAQARRETRRQLFRRPGFIIGVTEGLVAAYVSSAYRDAIVYGILIAALLVRPEGLLGRR